MRCLSCMVKFRDLLPRQRLIPKQAHSLTAQPAKGSCASSAQKPSFCHLNQSVATVTSILADLQAVFQTQEAGLLIVSQALNGDLGPGADDSSHIIHSHSRNRCAALCGRPHLQTPDVRSCAVLTSVTALLQC